MGGDISIIVFCALYDINDIEQYLHKRLDKKIDENNSLYDFSIENDVVENKEINIP